MKYNKKQGPQISAGRIVFSVVAVGLAAVAVAISWPYWQHLHAASASETPRTAQPMSSAPVTPQAPVDPLARLDRKAAALVGPPPRYTPIFVQAASARAVINRGDFVGADKIINGVLARSRIGNYHFRPFADFIEKVSSSRNPKFPAQLRAWSAQDHTSATPYLLRARFSFQAGWAARGNGFIADIKQAHIDQFAVDMQKAEKDVSQAMRLDPHNPYSDFLWLSIVGADGNSTAMEAAFQQAIGRFPNYYPLYQSRLSSLQPKWGGTPQAMDAFVDHYAGSAPANSPLRMLYVQLYSDLLDTSAIVCSDAIHAPPDCVVGVMNQLVTRRLNRGAYAALQMYDHTDAASFSLEIGSILQTMIDTVGADRPTSALLQLAAHSMHSDNALVATDTAKNNFMMDAMAALVWYRAGEFDNAETLYKRAIADLGNIQFANDEQRDAVRASLYGDLAQVYTKTHRLRQVIVYQEAANALDGPGYADLECAALYRLKLYADAVHVCTQQIQVAGDAEARFWRARAYEAVQKPDLALPDYQRVAASGSRFRSAAAIDISVIYGRKNDMPAMLKALDSYHYLYDPATEDREDIAIAYNNRCYARMHLGDLRGALKDCSASLHFGNLPDAYAKQQQLILLLKRKGLSVPARHPAQKQAVPGALVGA